MRSRNRRSRIEGSLILCGGPSVSGPSSQWESQRPGPRIRGPPAPGSGRPRSPRPFHGCGGPSHRRLFSRSVRTAGRATGLAVLISHAPTNQVSAWSVPEQNHLARCRDAEVSDPASRVPPPGAVRRELDLQARQQPRRPSITKDHSVNVPDSPWIGNPVNRSTKDLQGHDLPWQVHQERLAQKHRPGYHRAARPEPRVVRDRAVVAQHEVLVVLELIRLIHAVRMPRDAAQSACVVNVPEDLEIGDAQRSALHPQGYRRFVAGWSREWIIIIKGLKKRLPVECYGEAVVDDRSLEHDRARPMVDLRQRSCPGNHELLVIVPSHLD